MCFASYFHYFKQGIHMAISLNQALHQAFPNGDFSPLGKGSALKWEKKYLSFDSNIQEWKVLNLNIFERIFRSLFGAYESTHLKFVVQQIGTENPEDLPADFLNRIHGLFNKVYPRDIFPIPVRAPSRSHQRISNIKNQIEQHLNLLMNKDRIKAALGEDGVSEEEFESAWKEYQNSLKREPQSSTKNAAISQESITSQDDQPLILAPNGLNQYMIGGLAACTRLACAFLKSQDPSSSSLIEKILQNNKYTEEKFEDTEEIIKELKLEIATNPWEEQAEFSPQSMQVSFKMDDQRDDQYDLKAALQSLIDSEINGAIITGNSLTISMRIKEKWIEFFDSHGDDALTKQGNAAYIQRFDRQKGFDHAVEFLNKRFPYLEGFSQVIVIYPITIN